MGYYNEEGWREDVGVLVPISGGVTAPVIEAVGGSGLYAYKFASGDEVLSSFIINYDIKPGGVCYPTMRFMPSTTMSAGETLSWTFEYNSARGRAGDNATGGVLTPVATTVTLGYTANGTEQAGEHLVATVTEGLTTPEVGSIILAKVTYNEGTYGEDVWGVACTLQYEADRNATPNREPNFYGN